MKTSDLTADEASAILRENLRPSILSRALAMVCDEALRNGLPSADVDGALLDLVAAFAIHRCQPIDELAALLRERHAALAARHGL